MGKSRIKVASVAKRLPSKALSSRQVDENIEQIRDNGNIDTSKNIEMSDNAKMTEIPRRSVGRPRKKPDMKAVPVTVTLWPEEYRALEALRQDLSQNMPVELPRSDLARLGISLLVEMKPEKVLAQLIKRRRR